MSFYKDRSEYFKSLAHRNKQVAHNRVVDGEERHSFHRMNGEEELQAACVAWAHFPCVVHAGISGRHTDIKQAVPKRKTSHTLLFLQKVDEVTSMDDREGAYDVAFGVMEDFIQEMWSSFLERGYCSPFKNLDLSRFSFSPVSINGNLFGWALTFEEDLFVDYLTRTDAAKWFD